MVNKTFKTQPGIPTAEQVIAMEDLSKNQDLLVLEERSQEAFCRSCDSSLLLLTTILRSLETVMLRSRNRWQQPPDLRERGSIKEVGLFNALDKVTLGGLLHFLAAREFGLEDFYSYSAAEAEHHVDAFVRHCQKINIQVSPRDVSVYQMSIKKHHLHQGITTMYSEHFNFSKSFVFHGLLFLENLLFREIVNILSL